MQKRRRTQTPGATAGAMGLQQALMTLVSVLLVDKAGGASTPPLAGKLSSVRSAAVESLQTPTPPAGYVSHSALRGLRQRPRALLSLHARRLGSRARSARLVVGKLSIGRTATPVAQLATETRPFVVTASSSSTTALLQGQGLSLLRRGVRTTFAADFDKEDIGEAKARIGPIQNMTMAAPGLLPQKRREITLKASDHSDLSSSAPAGHGITIASNRSAVAVDNSTGDGKSGEGSHRQDDTVGSELRQREREQFLGLPKLFWALVADVVVMGAFVLCIPWILHIARRRRAAPVQN